MSMYERSRRPVSKFQEWNYLSHLSLPKSQECIWIRSLCCLNQMDLVGIDFKSMMPEAIQAVDCWSKWCSVVNKKVWCKLCLYQCLKSSKLLSKWKWCSVVDKTNQAASLLPTEFGSICIHAIDVTEDCIEAVQDLTSEGQANKSKTWPVKVEQTSEGDLTQKSAANVVYKVKHANER